MTLSVARLPFALDPLIAEAKRRGRQRRFLSAVTVAVLVAAILVGALVLRGSSGPSGGPAYPHRGVVPPGVREIDIQSAFPNANPAASMRVTRPETVGSIARLIDALAVVRHPNTNAICPAIDGPTVTLLLRGGDGALLANAGVVSGDGGGLSPACNPLLFSRDGRASSPVEGHNPQLVLTGRTREQAQFVRQLQRVVGAPLCQRSTSTPAEDC